MFLVFVYTFMTQACHWLHKTINASDVPNQKRHGKNKRKLFIKMKLQMKMKNKKKTSGQSAL